MDALPARLLQHLSAACGASLAGRHLCVALSGGLDSVVLLHALSGLRDIAGFRLSALHVHHGLNPRAEDWVQHCASLCSGLALPLDVQRVAVVADGSGLEAAARLARHAAFARCEADWIVLAHHRDDQAETVLHNLLRGAGLRGMAGMAPADPARRLLRPLLDEPRQVLLDYAHAQRLTWVEDDSNLDTRFTRNFLRHEILPRLGTRFPAASTTLARAATHVRESAQLLDELAQGDWQSLNAAPVSARARWRALGPARARNLLRWLLGQHAEIAPSAARLEDWVGQLSGTAGVRIPYGKHAVCAWRDRLWIEALPQHECLPVEWSGQASLPWGMGCVRFVRAQGRGALRLLPETGLLLAPARAGLSLRLQPGGPNKTLRKLCQEREIPPWRRGILPVIWQGDVALWVGGIGAAAEAWCSDDEAGWRVAWDEECPAT